MVFYIVLNLPYMILHTLLSPASSPSRQIRKVLAISFFATLVPLVYFYLQHKVHRIAGAYSIYALLEWSLIILDVSFDSVFVTDFQDQNETSPPISLELHSHKSTTANDSTPPHFLSTFFLQSRKLATLSDIYLSYLFWTILTALGPCIFYSSVWSMGLSGYEVLLFSILSPALLVIPSLQKLFSLPSFGNFGLLVGIASRWLPDEPDQAGGHGLRRLSMLSIGLALGTMGKVAEWWKIRKDSTRLQARSSTFLLGLILSLLAKYANHSLNPMWCFVRSTDEEKTNNGGQNGIGLALAILAYLQAAYRRELGSVVSTARVKEKKEKKSDDISPRPPFGSGIASCLGFGGLFFLLVLLYTDTGTTIAWSFNGYPTSGPHNVPHGALTILALSLGVLLPFISPSFTRRLSLSPISFLSACICATLTYSQTSWLSYIPALVLGTYSTVIFPSYLSSILRHTSTPSSFFLAWFVYSLLVLASTFAVAYAFVPGGAAFRERMDLVLGSTMVLIGFGLYPFRFQRNNFIDSQSPSRTMRRHVSFAFLVIVFASLAISGWRYHTLWMSIVRSNDPENRVISAAIWTVHFGLDGK